jgi:hypothetical protein
MIDDPPTRAGFVTALNDAYLVPRDSGYAIFWRTSGHDLCTVDRDVAERALRGDRTVIRLGSWSGTIRGRKDRWTVWWSRGVPWASTSDVSDGDHTLRLIENWRAQAAQAQARGQHWEPLPPGVAPPPPPVMPTPGRRPRTRMVARLRALLQME